MQPAIDGQRRVSAIVPAFSEGRTISDVIAVLKRHQSIGEVIVVSDGSTDDTVARATEAGACVIAESVNRGKAAAIERGVQAAVHEHILLLDGDIKGLTIPMITQVITPVLRGEFAMFVALRGRSTYWLNRLLRFTPIIGGERALTRSLWSRVPTRYKRRFQIEIALNFFVKRHGGRMGFAVMPGLTQVIKERKRGLWLGLYQRLSMCVDIVVIAVRLYVVFNLLSLFTRLRPQQRQSIGTALGPFPR